MRFVSELRFLEWVGKGLTYLSGWEVWNWMLVCTLISILIAVLGYRECWCRILKFMPTRISCAGFAVYSADAVCLWRKKVCCADSLFLVFVQQRWVERTDSASSCWKWEECKVICLLAQTSYLPHSRNYLYFVHKAGTILVLNLPQPAAMISLCLASRSVHPNLLQHRGRS